MKLIEPLLAVEGLQTEQSVIMDAWAAVRRDRNEFWHPDDGGGTLYAFDKQTTVHPNLIAFRMVAALVVGTLHDLGVVKDSSKIAKYAPAVEHWIAAISENDGRDPEDAADMSHLVQHYVLRQTVRTTLAGMS